MSYLILYSQHLIVKDGSFIHNSFFLYTKSGFSITYGIEVVTLMVGLNTQ